MTNQAANTITESDAIRSVAETRKALRVPLALELLTAVGEGARATKGDFEHS